MLRERVDGSRLCTLGHTSGRWPDVEDVIIATAGQIPAIRRPRQATDLLRMTCHRAHVVVGHAHVVLVDIAATTSTAKFTKSIMSTLSKLNEHEPVNQLFTYTIPSQYCGFAIRHSPGQYKRVPCQSTNTRSMTCHDPHSLHLHHIPDLQP